MTGFPLGLHQPVRHAAPLPAACDVVVIGGGVIGICTAIFAAARGLRVVVLEKGRVAAEQSSRNWGWIRQQGRDASELPVMVEALRHWQDFARRLGGDLGFRQTGVVYLASDEAELASYDRWCSHARAHDVDSRLLGRAEVGALLPGLRDKVAGALHTPSDGRAEPFVAVPMLADLAAREGVGIVESCAVRGLDIAAGRVAGVVTEAGRIACDQVVLAGGAWSSLFLRAHGVTIPQLAVRASVAVTTPLAEVFAGAQAGEGWALRRRADGGYTLAPGTGGETMFIGPDALRHLRWYLPQLRRAPFGQTYRPAAPAGFPDAWTTSRRWSPDRPGPFEVMRVLDPAPDRRALDRAARAALAAYPALGQGGRLPLRLHWAGMIDTMPDIVPVVDRIAALPGLILATGMSGHGFGIGPGFGRVVADLLAGRAPGHDLGAFRADRFDGAVRLAPGTSL